MQSPSDSNETTRLPPPVNVVKVNNQVKSPSDTITQLSQASSGARATLSSPLRAADIGVPKTPPQILIAPVDDALIEQGYDSDGRRLQWKKTKDLDFDGPELEEEAVRFDPPPLSPVEPIQENVAKNLVIVENVHTMIVNQLKDE